MENSENRDNMENMDEIVERLKKTFGANIKSSESTYRCSKCRDVGWIDVTDEEGRKIVRKCECLKAREAEQLLRASGLADAVSQQTFDSFIAETPIQKTLKETAQRYLNEAFSMKNQRRRPWLYVGGNPGSGKTHICTAVCGELLKRNIQVRYMQWVPESRKLKAIVTSEFFDDYIRDYINCSVLYIDDFLKQKYTERPDFSDADIRLAFAILDNRYELNKPTIISTEWDLVDQLLPVDEGLFSRTYECSKGFTVRISRDPRNNYRMTR